MQPETYKTFLKEGVEKWPSSQSLLRNIGRQVQEEQVTGKPSWIHALSYDIWEQLKSRPLQQPFDLMALQHKWRLALQEKLWMAMGLGSNRQERTMDVR
jgi:hypothetical protein